MRITLIEDLLITETMSLKFRTITYNQSHRKPPESTSTVVEPYLYNTIVMLPTYFLIIYILYIYLFENIYNT